MTAIAALETRNNVLFISGFIVAYFYFFVNISKVSNNKKTPNYRGKRAIRESTR